MKLKELLPLCSQFLRYRVTFGNGEATDFTRDELGALGNCAVEHINGSSERDTIILVLAPGGDVA
jgi:hypothetical protein